MLKNNNILSENKFLMALNSALGILIGSSPLK